MESIQDRVGRVEIFRDNLDCSIDMSLICVVRLCGNKIYSIRHGIMCNKIT